MTDSKTGSMQVTHTQPYLSFATTCLHYEDSTEGSDQLMGENQLVEAEPEQENWSILESFL